MEALREAGRILRRLREERGWSQVGLAAELARQAKRAGRSVPSRESLVRMVRMWESGTHRPRDYYDLLVLAYADADELSARAAVPGSDLDRLMTAFEIMGVLMDRRKFLLNSAALAVGVTAEPSLLDLFDDDPVRHAVGRLRYLQDLLHAGEPAGPVYRLLVRHAKNLDSLASRFKGSATDGELRAVQAWTLGWAGQTAAGHLNDHVAAESDCRAGLQAARQSSDLRLRAKLCVHLAQRRIHDPGGNRRSNLYDALWLVNSATQYADKDPFVLTDIYTWQAFIHASLGNEHGTTDALQRAAMTIEHATPINKPEWLPNMSMTTVRETVGCSYIRLGKAGTAAEELARALESRNGDTDYPSRVHRSMVLTWGSQAYAMLRDPEHAVVLLREAVPTVSTSKSARLMGEVRTARTALQSWNGERYVRELDEQLAAAGLA